MNVNQWNNISSELKKIVQDALPKRGQVIYFESLRPKARGTTVYPKDRIWDPWGGVLVDDKQQGDYIDIAFIDGRQPGTDAKGNNQDPNKYGRIQFKKLEGGRIQIRGGNRSDEQLFTYLFLTNFNLSNKGKDWYVDTASKCFKMIEPNADAKTKLEEDRKYRVAADAIDTMSEEKLREFAVGLDMKGINKHSDPDEIRVKLMAIARQKGGADRVLSLDKDVSIQVKNVVKAAENYGLIKRDAALGYFLWADSDEPICTVPPNRNVYEFLTQYFLGKGAKAYEMLVMQVERKREVERAKKVTKPKIEEPKAEAPVQQPVVQKPEKVKKVKEKVHA